MTHEEEARFFAIIYGEQAPDPEAHARGRRARGQGNGFRQCPYRPLLTVLALSWRIGWNDRALELRLGRRVAPIRAHDAKEIEALNDLGAQPV